MLPYALPMKKVLGDCAYIYATLKTWAVHWTSCHFVAIKLFSIPATMSPQNWLRWQQNWAFFITLLNNTAVLSPELFPYVYQHRFHFPWDISSVNINLCLSWKFCLTCWGFPKHIWQDLYYSLSNYVLKILTISK